MPNINSIPLKTKELQRYAIGKRQRIPQSLDIWQLQLASRDSQPASRDSQPSFRNLQLTSHDLQPHLATRNPHPAACNRDPHFRQSQF